jgi:hypothetical protein
MSFYQIMVQLFLPEALTVPEERKRVDQKARDVRLSQNALSDRVAQLEMQVFSTLSQELRA